MNYKESYKSLVKVAHSKGLKVTGVKDRTTKDYVGMNDLAARKLGYKIRKKTIYVDKNLNYKVKAHTLNHEIIERDRMSKGDSYWVAHKKALKLEKRLR